MAGYSIKVGANTSGASKALKKLGKDLDVATKARKIVLDKTGIKSYQTAFKQAGNAAQKSLKAIASSEAQVRKGLERTSKAVNPTTFLTGSFTKAAQSAGKLIDVTAKLTVAIYGVNAAVGVLTRSFGGFFNQTIGRAAKFEATLLKTKTTLASTNDVFVGGKKISDPLKAIEALSGSIDERVKSIRKRTLELAGVTSGEVVEVFGIVASQAGQVNLSLKEAEDLAINFAGALGTFGIPLYQARQEITSILQGNINQDSYLAKALGITSEDIQKARTQVGGIAKFLDDKLGTAVAGQAIAAKQLSGVTSNIVEVWENFSQAIGEVALDPLISGLTFVFETLNKSLEVIKKIGSNLGKIGAGVGTGIANAAGFNAQNGQGTGSAAQQQAKAQFAAINQSLASFSAKINNVFDAVAKSLGKLITEVGKAVAVLSSAFAELGGAVVDLGIEQFKALVGALAQVAPLLTGLVAGTSDLIKAWADFLKLPLVKTLVAIAATFKVMQMTGINAFVGIVVKAIIFKVQLIKIITVAKLVFTKIKTGVAIVIKAIGRVLVAISQVIQSLTQVGVKTGVVSKKAAADMNKLAVQTKKVGLSAKTAAASFGLMRAGILKATVAMKAFLASTVGLLLLQVALSAIVYVITKVQEGMSKAAANNKLQTSIDYLNKTAEKAADGGLSSLEERLRDIAKGKVNTKIDEITQKIAELNEEIAKEEGKRDGRSSNLRGGGTTRSRAIANINKLNAEKEKNVKKIAELEKSLGIKTEQDKAEIKAKEAKKLGKELTDFERQQQNELFRKRMELARKEVEVFRSAGELRIRQMEIANSKLIEGEEGASRTALEALNNYLSQKERGELDIAAQRQSLELTMQNRAKTLEDYRLKIQEQINKLREKIGKYEKEVADYRLKQAQKEGQGKTKQSGGTQGVYTQGGIGPKGSNQYGPHLDIARTDGSRFGRSELDKYVMFGGKPLSQSTTVSGGQFGASRDGGSRTHRAWDYALEPGAQMQLTGGAQWTGSSKTSYGDSAVFMTPDGKTYRVIHGTFDPMGSAGASGPEMPVDTSSAEIGKLNEQLAGTEERMISIRENLNELSNAQAFENITKALYPESSRRLEGAEDARARAQASLNAVGQGGSQAASQIEIDIETRRSRMTKERAQFEEKLAKTTKVTGEERLRLTEEFDAAQVKANNNLDEERRLRIETNALLEQTGALRDVDQRIQNLQESNELLQQRNRLEEEGVTGPALDGALKLFQLRQEMNRQIANGVELTEGLRQKYADLANEIQKTTAIQVAAADPVNQLMKQYKDNISDTRGQIASLAATVTNELGTALSSSISGLIDGTTTVQEAFGKMFENIGKAFIEMATQILAQKLVLTVLQAFSGGGGTPILGNNLGNFGGGNFGGFFANGGRPPTNRMSVIGESGPELFIPDAPGTILSNTQAFAAARSAMSSGAGEVTPEGDSGTTLGASTAFAQNTKSITTTNNLIRERERQIAEKESFNSAIERSTEATMGAGGSMIIETQVINNVEYASVDQVEKASALAVKQARAQVFSAMKNRPAIRRQVGVK